MITIDLEGAVVTETTEAGTVHHPLASPEAFAIVSRAWLRAGWDTKYVYSFSWMGRPVIQLPEDLVRMQEVIHALRPTVVVETGVAHGGSLVFYASLMKAMDLPGRVIGVDIEIRPHNRTAIEAHPLASMITLVEGSSTDPEIVAAVRARVRPDDVVLVVLDSNHSRDHVLDELRLYAPLVTPGSWIVATDGIMGTLGNAPRTAPDWSWNNPEVAARAFLAENPAFVHEIPTRPFNEGADLDPVTYWPGAWLRRVA